MPRMARYFQELIYIKEVIEHGSISKAARQIGISQSALTRSIKRVEDSLGATLLNRTARGVYATPFGDVLLSHIRSIAEQLDRANAALSDLRSGDGCTINCGATSGGLTSLLPSAIAEFKADRPQYRLRVLEGSQSALMAMLRIGHIDLAVCPKSDDRIEPELSSEVLGSEWLGAFVRRGHPLSKRESVSLPVLLEQESWLFPNPWSTLYTIIQMELDRLGLPMPRKVVESSSGLLIRPLLESTDFIAICGSRTLTSELLEGKVVELGLGLRLPDSRTTLFQRTNVPPLPAVSAFIRCLRRAARARPQLPRAQAR